MKKPLLIILSLLSFLLSSCYTYKVYPLEYRKPDPQPAGPRVYIINDTLPKEREILTHSNLFTVVPDSAGADILIKLYPLDRAIVCGQAMTASMITLGQLPVLFPDRYNYIFDEIKQGMVTTRKLELKVAQRVWFWDMFVFKKRFEEKAGLALLGEYRSSY